MKKFLFRLERVLHLRERLEKDRAKSLGDALRGEAESQAALDEAAGRLERAGEQACGGEGQIAPAGALRNMNFAVQAAARELEAAEQSHADAERTVEQEQERYGEARRDRRVIERLREQRKEVWDSDAAREEQTHHDGVAHQRHKGREAR